MNRFSNQILKWSSLFVITAFFISCKSVASYYKTTKQQYTFDVSEETIKPKKAYSTTLELPIKLADDFIWGINGHPIDAKPYNFPGSLNLQMDLLKELQLTQYRVNVTLNEDGEAAHWPGDVKKWQETLEKSKDAGVTIFPVIQLRDFDFSMGIDKAYTTAKKQTSGFAKKYKEEINHYALGNEMDLLLVNKGKDGSKIAHYDLKKFDVWISFLKGMAAGIRKEDPSAKLVINGAGRHYLGYYEYIKKQQVDYDIIGFHWYSEMGKVAAPYLSEKGGLDIMQYMHQQFMKPIWITEINQHWGVNKHPENHQAFWMDHFIDNLEGRDYIKAFFVYELLDQPHLDDNEGYDNKRQAYFGLIDWVEPYTKHRYRPAAITYKYKIEEITNGNQNYADALKELLQISNADKKELIRLLNTNKTAEKAITFGMSKATSPLVKNAKENFFKNKEAFIMSSFKSILKRNPTEKEQLFWEKELKKESNPENLLITLFKTLEFFKYTIVNGYEERTGFTFYKN